LIQRKSTGDDDPKPFLIIDLEEVLVSSYNTGASEGSGPPVESFSFNYSKIKVEYKVQNTTTGGMEAGGEFAYNVKEGKNV
jgi:type VI secretion system secreted protein Hcp